MTTLEHARGLSVIGVIGALALTMFSAQATTAFADSADGVVTCHGEACTGLDPIKTHCADDAKTQHSLLSPEMIVLELRYSEACETAWGKISNAKVGDKVLVQGSAGANYPAAVTTGLSVYTLMVDRHGLTAKACVQAAVTPSLTCTDSF